MIPENQVADRSVQHESLELFQFSLRVRPQVRGEQDVKGDRVRVLARHLRQGFEPVDLVDRVGHALVDLHVAEGPDHAGRDLEGHVPARVTDSDISDLHGITPAMYPPELKPYSMITSTVSLTPGIQVAAVC